MKNQICSSIAGTLLLIGHVLMLTGCASERVGFLDPEAVEGPLTFVLDDYEAMLGNGASPTAEPLTAAEIGDREFMVRQVRQTLQVALDAKAAESDAVAQDVVVPSQGGDR